MTQDRSAICVITCVWQRPERFEHTLSLLAEQTDQDFDLWVICNNPDLHDFVMERPRMIPGSEDPFTPQSGMVFNEENRGPYARIELMHEECNNYRWFLTIDDDAEFGPDWIEQWKRYADPYTVLGWQGFRFTGDYWQNRQPPNEVGACHYLWGSNMMVPAAVAADPGILDLERRYWNCDDLWLCYWANKVMGYPLRQVQIEGMRIEVDGKDAYHSQHEIKIELLEELRSRGWRV